MRRRERRVEENKIESIFFLSLLELITRKKNPEKSGNAKRKKSPVGRQKREREGERERGRQADEASGFLISFLGMTQNKGMFKLYWG